MGILNYMSDQWVTMNAVILLLNVIKMVGWCELWLNILKYREIKLIVLESVVTALYGL